MRRLLLLLLALPVAAAAQQEERLPDLTPQEFEIRGDLQVSLPNLERQPLRGFAPPPRTYVVPADRQPFVAPYAQRLEDLPDSPLPAPATPSLLPLTPRIGQIDLMAGRYMGRRGRLTVGAGGFGFDVLYTGYSGFTYSPQLPDDEAQADNLSGRLTLAGGDALRYALAGDAAYHEYGLMGAYASLPMAPGSIPPSTRQLQTLGVEGRLEGSPPLTPFTLFARFESSRIDDPARGEILPIGGNDLDGESLLETSESRLTLDGMVDAGPARLEARAGMSGLYDEGLGTSLLDFDAGVSTILAVTGARLRIGARVFGFDASEANGGESLVRVGPLVEFDGAISPEVTFYAWNRSGTEPRGLAGLLVANPYAMVSPRLAPDVHLINAEGGLELQLHPVLLNVYAGVRRSPHLLYFDRDPLEQFSALYVAHYDAGALYRTGGNLTVHGPHNISASAGLELRSARLTDQDRATPFVSPMVWRLSVALPFARDAGLLQAALHIESSRPTEIEDERAPAWGDLNVEAHYRFAGRFGLLARADHLGLRAERWPGFPQPRTVIMAGVRAGW